MKNVLLLGLILGLCSCRTVETRITERYKELGEIKRLNLTSEHYGYFKKYIGYRKRVTDYLRLPAGASEEDVRREIALALELKKDASWEILLNHEMIRPFFTDERRQKCARLLGLPADTSWIGFKDYLESLREKK